jgi:hypothetical protein
MGGSSKQVTGYKYFANFLLFIGNPIERLIAINFDKRGWQTGERVPFGSNGEMAYIEKPNLYGENEGGVYGTMRIKHGTNAQTACVQYKKYMDSIGLPVSAYPYQSYILFDGGGFPDGAYGLTEEELEVVGDDLEENSNWYGGGFYLGNSGYMKEMLLWPKRIHVKNDGSEQWYAAKAEIPDYIQSIAEETKRIIIEGENTVAKYQSISGAELSQSMPIGTGQRLSLGTSDSGSLFPVIDFDVSAVGVSGVAFAEISFNQEYCVLDFSSENRIVFEKIEEISTGVINKTYVLQASSFYPFCSLELKEKNDGSITSGTDNAFSYTINFYDQYSYQSVDARDINPIHKIREILTDDTAMNKPESDVNDENFMKAADRIWDERLGISWAITEKSCINAINELCSHIEAGIRVNRQTGLYEMVLFRDDWFEEEEIHTLAENKIKSISFEVQNADEAINQLNVSYYDRDNIKDASFSVSENAAIKNANGFVNAEDADFPYFMNQRNAAVVAQWKLKQYTTPCWKGTFTTGFSEARKWNRYDIVKINWLRKGIIDLPVRIMSINLGNGIDNTVSIEFVEVVSYSSELTSTIVIDEKIDTSPLPPLACQYEPFEMPYYLSVMALGQRKVDDQLIYDSDIGLVGTVAERPQSNSLYAVMMTNNGDEWERAGSIQYSETADLDQIISRVSSSFTVKNWKMIVNISVGTLIKCGSDWIGTPSEWMVFQGVDPYTGVISVKRGALDTVPQEWGIDTKLYFCGSDVDYDPTEYIAGEEILVSALTTTPSGMLENKGSIPIEMKARAIRPYPPANVQINGEYFPSEIETDLILTWVDRNRIQQTGGGVLGWYDGAVTLEAGCQYQLSITEFDMNGIDLRTQNINVGTLNTYTLPTSSMQPATRSIEITLKSIRDGYECLQPFVYSFELSSFFSAPYNIAATVRTV